MNFKSAFFSTLAELARRVRFERRCAFCAAPFQPQQPDGGAACAKPFAPVVPTAPAAPVVPVPPPAPVCPDCLQRLAALRPDAPAFNGMAACSRCGELIAAVPGTLPLCGSCLVDPPPWEVLYFYGFYQGYLRDLLLRLKFSHSLHLAEALGRLLAAQPLWQASAAFWNCLVPIPLHPARLRERGFNQAALLAAPLARPCLPLRQKLLRRVVDSAHQTGLSRSQRQRNTSGIFAASPLVAGRSVLLLDDVMTTGSTLRSATQCLLEAGAERVGVAVMGRTAGRNWQI